MRLRHARLCDVGVGAVIGSAMLIELATEGVLVVGGLLFLGAGVGLWVLLYDRRICADQPVGLPRAMVWATRGAVVMPPLAALHLVLGMLAWGLAAVALLAGFVAITMRSTVMHIRPAPPNAYDT